MIKHHPETIESYEALAVLYSKLKNCKNACRYAEKALIAYQYHDSKNDIARVMETLKEIKWNIKKAKKLPVKRRGKYCKDSQH
ncbi:MAG TPA: hypothetical protein ENJ33_04720 [Thiothrix sp.]|nr:hypothetical protein [Thiothrix sp.]